MMSTLYKRFFDTRLLGAPYDRPDDHVLDMVRRCEMVLYAYLSCLDPSGRTEKIGQLLRTVTQPDRVRGAFTPNAALSGYTNPQAGKPFPTDGIRSGPLPL